MGKSLGEKRVRVDFNVSGQSDVDDIKYSTASVINRLEGLKLQVMVEENGLVVAKTINDPEQLRLISLAQTYYEEAAMWAVKAITFK